MRLTVSEALYIDSPAWIVTMPSTKDEDGRFEAVVAIWVAVVEDGVAVNTGAEMTLLVGTVVDRIRSRSLPEVIVEVEVVGTWDVGISSMRTLVGEAEYFRVQNYLLAPTAPVPARRWKPLGVTIGDKPPFKERSSSLPDSPILNRMLTCCRETKQTDLSRAI
jgi:hypothetical protein